MSSEIALSDIPSPSQFIGLTAIRRFNHKKFSAVSKNQVVIVPETGELTVKFIEHGASIPYVSSPIGYVQDESAVQHEIFVDEVTPNYMKIRAWPGATIHWHMGGYVRNVEE